MRKILYMALSLLVVGGIMQQVQAEEDKAPVENSKTAIFAGGCFWCIESEFQEREGVLSVVSGYTGGVTENPRYEEVITKKTGHVEAVEVSYDPAKIKFEELLEVFWSSIDPTDEGGQFYDRGSQYETVIFYADDAEKNTAESSKAHIAKMIGKTIATRIEPRKVFYKAEEAHQDYYLKNPIHYNAYVLGSGRKKKIKNVYDGVLPVDRTEK